LKNELTKDNTMLKSIAHQIESTEKPGTTLLANKTIKPFIINVNNPRVRMLRGSVKTRRTGFMKRFAILKTSAATVAAKKSRM